MLPRATLEAALPLTEQLDARSMFLRPIVGTPLDALVRATRADAQFNVKLDGGGWSPDIENIEFIANKQPSDGTLNAHDCAMDSIVAIGITSVQKSMFTAKNVVGPAIQDLVERVSAAMQQATPSVLLGLEVKIVELPKLLSSTVFEGAVRKYQDTPLDDVRMVVNMPSLSDDELTELMMAGGAGANGDIKEFIAAQGVGFLQSLWTRVFQINAAVNSGSSFLQVINGDEGLANAIGIFLLSRRLMDAAPSGVPMSASQLATVMSEFRNQSAARICRAIDEQSLIAKAGTVVRRQTKKQVTVNGAAYRKWLQAGGSNEVLFGNMLSERPAYLAKDLSERGPELKKAWDKHSAITNTVEQGRRVIRTKELLSQCFEEQVNAVSEGDVSLAGPRLEVVKLFNAMLEDVREEELKDIYGLAMRLVCRSRFANTDAERILTGIEQVKRDNPNLEVREAAAISMIQYVAWWVGTQFKVEFF